MPKLLYDTLEEGAPTLFSKIESYRKFVVAVVVPVVGTVVAVLSSADFSTLSGVIAGVVAFLTAFGVYVTPNKPSA